MERWGHLMSWRMEGYGQWPLSEHGSDIGEIFSIPQPSMFPESQFPKNPHYLQFFADPQAEMDRGRRVRWGWSYLQCLLMEPGVHSSTIAPFPPWPVSSNQLDFNLFAELKSFTMGSQIGLAPDYHCNSQIPLLFPNSAWGPPSPFPCLLTPHLCLNEVHINGYDLKVLVLGGLFPLFKKK
jgi:hypothetical protein